MPDDLTTPLDPPAQAPARRWQEALREGFSRPRDLLDFLHIDPRLPALEAGMLRDFPMRVPRGYAGRMHRGDPCDPLFLQVWPSAKEAQIVPGFGIDAVGDQTASRGDGLIQKYRGRALLVTTGACAVHCRYCFRRHFPYTDDLASRGRWRPALAQIARDSSVSEIILSGGDPLALSDPLLLDLIQGLNAIPHLRRLRFHSRLPIVLPERIDDGLLSVLAESRFDTVMVVHANHAQELDDSVAEACARMRHTGITLLNQSVLLRNVNDDTAALIDLQQKLFSIGILPYYLHLVDRVQGAAHFEVPEGRGRQLMREISAELPGYLVPRLAREIPGQPAKQWIQW